MRILGFIILLSSVGITYTVAQRRQQNAAEVQPDTQTNPTGATLRGRGRARFVKTPEFEQVSSDYTAAARTTASEGKTRSLPGAGTIRHNSIRKPSGSNTRRLYEVQEFVDDIPDRSAPSSVYHRPRVITENKFEIPNAPRSKLFEPETNPIPQVNDDELIKTFGSLRSDEPTKLELPQVLSLSENDQSEPNAVSSTTSKEETSSEELSSSSTTEAEMERELLKKQQPESSSTTIEVTSSTAAPVRRTIIRSRNNAARQLNTENGPTTSASSIPTRTRGRSRLTAPVDSASAPSSTRSRPTETPTESESTAPRGSFRVGRRRPISNLKDRGPSVVEEDSQAPKTRTGRDSVSQYTSRRGSVRNTTPRLSEPAVEATTRNRADVRRSRGRKFESATNVPTENVPVNNGNRPTEFVSRRTRTRAPVVQEQRASSRIDNVASSRSFSEPIRSRNQPEPSATTAPRDSRARTRSRFQLSDIENVKLEPQQSIEHSTRAIPRRQGRTRPPLIQTEELVASSTVENPIRVTLPSTSTIRSVNSIPTRIKESVHSEVSEVISSRKVSRRKKPTAKASVTKKSQEVEDDIDELNYPPQFKAIILANQSKAKDDKKVEDVDNDLAPTPRPTRRRFSVSTRKPNSEGGITSSRKPKTLPTRKLVAHPDPEKIAKFHARFNTQSQRENSSNDPVVSTTTTKRTTKAPSKLSYTRKSDKLTDRKVYQAPTKTNRYSSRYRSETRSSVPTRAATTSPIYIPTVPTVTPGSVFAPSSHQDDTWSETEPWFMSIINQ